GLLAHIVALLYRALSHFRLLLRCVLSFFTATATPRCYPLSLHDALPICTRRREPRDGRRRGDPRLSRVDQPGQPQSLRARGLRPDRKSTRLNSSHQIISYAVFCLKKKRRSKREIVSSKTIHRLGTRPHRP